MGFCLFIVRVKILSRDESEIHHRSIDPQDALISFGDFTLLLFFLKVFCCD
jgi:hypothetical protein